MVIISFISISCFISTVSWECGRSRCRFSGSGGGVFGGEGVLSGVWRMLKRRIGDAGVGMGASLGVACLGVVMGLSFVIWNRVLNYLTIYYVTIYSYI